MKAWVVCHASTERFRLVETPAPIQGAGELQLEVQSVSLNPGELRWSWADGTVPGWDVAGVVAEAAADGRGPGVGERVVAVCEGGAWAEKVVVPVGRVGVIPDTVSFEVAATLGIAGLTALRVVREAGPLAGKRVLVTGASGAVGRLAVQLSRLYSATVTGVVNREEQASELRALGAHAAIVGTSEVTGAYDVIFDGVGGEALVAGLRVAAPRAQIFTYGSSGGESAYLSFRDFRGAPGAALRGFFVWLGDLETFGSDLSYLARLVAADLLEAPVGRVYPWGELDRAVKDLESRRFRGKLVVTRT